MTYRSFSEPQKLLDLLISRFHIPMPIVLDDHDRRDPMLMKAVKRYKANYVSPIQLRCVCVCVCACVRAGVHTNRQVC